MQPKRITLFAGHYGSGKTNIAVNYALHLKKNGKSVVIADLDIVNPYFRTKDSEELLKEAGINLVSPRFANTNVDLPSLPQELYGVVENRQNYAVMDIGGDDRGALALGRYAPSILEENDYEMIFVLNCYRPLTRTPEDIISVMREIEEASKIPFTAIANNSNVGWDTTVEDFMNSVPIAVEVSKLTGLPIIMNTAEERVAQKLKVPNLFALNLQKKYYDIKEK